MRGRLQSMREISADVERPSAPERTTQSGFAQIGLFAGGAAASGVEYARKTSEATMTLVQMVKAGIRVNAMDVKVMAFAG
jgi:hypothetical protein